MKIYNNVQRHLACFLNWLYYLLQYQSSVKTHEPHFIQYKIPKTDRTLLNKTLLCTAYFFFRNNLQLTSIVVIGSDLKYLTIISHKMSYTITYTEFKRWKFLYFMNAPFCHYCRDAAARVNIVSFSCASDRFSTHHTQLSVKCTLLNGPWTIVCCASTVTIQMSRDNHEKYLQLGWLVNIIFWGQCSIWSGFNQFWNIDRSIEIRIKWPNCQLILISFPVRYRYGITFCLALAS